MSNATSSGSEVSRQADHSDDEGLNQFLGPLQELFARRAWSDCLALLDEAESLFPFSGKISVERGLTVSSGASTWIPCCSCQSG